MQVLMKKCQNNVSIICIWGCITECKSGAYADHNVMRDKDLDYPG